jgi:hypothetical protein
MFLVSTAFKLRKMLAREKTSGQADIIFQYLKPRWGIQQKADGSIEQGLLKGYSIPDVHDGEVICS